MGAGNPHMQKNRFVCSKKRQIPVICIILQPWSLMGKRQNKRSCATDRSEPGFRADAAEEGICVLLECMSNLTANELYLDTGAKERTREAVLEGIRELEKRCRGLVAVTNEVFCDLPPADEEMQEYLSVLGTINCRMAKMADQVTEVVYGIPVEVKKG